MGRRYRERDDDDEEEEEGDCWEVMAKLGMPLLYIAGIFIGIIAAICQGVISDYWANLDPPTCFLYAQTASASVVYKFGSSITICHWITYGAVTAVLIAFIAGIVYIIKVRNHKDLTLSSALSLTGIILAMLLMLAVTCTMAEGLRISCSAMGLNSANNKGESCYDKLNKRVIGDHLPVQTSILVRASLISLICSTVVFFIISCLHISDFYRRTLRHRYAGVSYDDRG